MIPEILTGIVVLGMLYLGGHVIYDLVVKILK